MSELTMSFYFKNKITILLQKTKLNKNLNTSSHDGVNINIFFILRNNT